MLYRMIRQSPVAPRFIENVKENVKAGVRGEKAERIYSKFKEK